MHMHVRKATESDIKDVARLALSAGEGTPAFFWSQSAAQGRSVEA